MKLKAEMTLLNGCTVIVGCIIGSGIFISPTGVLQSTGSVNMSLVVWTISGIFTMLGRSSNCQRQTFLDQNLEREAMESVMCGVIKIRLKRRDERRNGKGNPLKKWILDVFLRRHTLFSDLEYNTV